MNTRRFLSTMSFGALMLIIGITSANAFTLPGFGNIGGGSGGSGLGITMPTIPGVGTGSSGSSTPEAPSEPMVPYTFTVPVKAINIPAQVTSGSFTAKAGDLFVLCMLSETANPAKPSGSNIMQMFSNGASNGTAGMWHGAPDSTHVVMQEVKVEIAAPQSIAKKMKGWGCALMLDFSNFPLFLGDPMPLGDDPVVNKQLMSKAGTTLTNWVSGAL